MKKYRQMYTCFLGMAIWEPCNYVSNLAYDRLVVEICNQKDWTLGEVDVKRIAEAFAIGIGPFRKYL